VRAQLAERKTFQNGCFKFRTAAPFRSLKAWRITRRPRACRRIFREQDVSTSDLKFRVVRVSLAGPSTRRRVGNERARQESHEHCTRTSHARAARRCQTRTDVPENGGFASTETIRGVAGAGARGIRPATPGGVARCGRRRERLCSWACGFSPPENRECPRWRAPVT